MPLFSVYVPPVTNYGGLHPNAGRGRPLTHFFYWHPKNYGGVRCAPHSSCYGGGIKFVRSACPVGRLSLWPYWWFQMLRCTPFTVAPSLPYLVCSACLQTTPFAKKQRPCLFTKQSQTFPLRHYRTLFYGGGSLCQRGVFIALQGRKSPCNSIKICRKDCALS